MNLSVFPLLFWMTNFLRKEISLQSKILISPILVSTIQTIINSLKYRFGVSIGSNFKTCTSTTTDISPCLSTKTNLAMSPSSLLSQDFPWEEAAKTTKLCHSFSEWTFVLLWFQTNKQLLIYSTS